MATREIAFARPVLPDVDVPRVTALSEEARASFGVGCFWNVAVLTDPEEDARLVVRTLRKYGGRRGWLVAREIEAAMRETETSHGTHVVPAGGVEAPGLEPLA